MPWSARTCFSTCPRLQQCSSTWDYSWQPPSHTWCYRSMTLHWNTLLALWITQSRCVEKGSPQHWAVRAVTRKRRLMLSTCHEEEPTPTGTRYFNIRADRCRVCAELLFSQRVEGKLLNDIKMNGPVPLAVPVFRAIFSHSIWQMGSINCSRWVTPLTLPSPSAHYNSVWVSHQGLEAFLLRHRITPHAA